MMKLQIKNQFDCVSENYNERTCTHIHTHTHCTSSFIIVMICSALCENLHISKTDGGNNFFYIQFGVFFSLLASTRERRAFCFCEHEKYLFHFNSENFSGAADFEILKSANSCAVSCASLTYRYWSPRWICMSVFIELNENYINVQFSCDYFIDELF